MNAKWYLGGGALTCCSGLRAQNSLPCSFISADTRCLTSKKWGDKHSPLRYSSTHFLYPLSLEGERGSVNFLHLGRGGGDTSINLELQSNVVSSKWESYLQYTSATLISNKFFNFTLKWWKRQSLSTRQSKTTLAGWVGCSKIARRPLSKSEWLRAMTSNR